MLKGRLAFLASKVKGYDCIADIGCDHGLLTKYLLDNKVIKSAILTDISLPSLNKARKLIEKEYPHCTFYHCDGVKEVREEFELAVIAGMGGLETIKIISEGDLKKCLLQPMNNVDLLRMKLVKEGYKILFDKIFFDRKFYDVLLIEKGEDSLSEQEIVFGRDNIKSPDEMFRLYLLHLQKKNENIIKQVPTGSDRFDSLKSLLDSIRLQLAKIGGNGSENCGHN